MEKEILALVNAIENAGGGVALILGAWLLWQVVKQVMEWKLGPQKRVRVDSSGGVQMGKLIEAVEGHRRDDIAAHTNIAEALHSVTKQLERCEESQRQTVRVLERLTDRVINLGD